MESRAARGEAGEGEGEFGVILLSVCSVGGEEGERLEGGRSDTSNMKLTPPPSTLPSPPSRRFLHPLPQIEAEQAALSPPSREAARKAELALQRQLEVDDEMGGGHFVDEADDAMDDEIMRYQAEAEQLEGAGRGDDEEEAGEDEGMDLS